MAEEVAARVIAISRVRMGFIGCGRFSWLVAKHFDPPRSLGNRLANTTKQVGCRRFSGNLGNDILGWF
jgi:hypothetical protein